MSDKVDSASWTGDTSHRATSFTPQARAEVAMFLRRILGFLVVGAAGVVVAKGVM